MKWPFRAKPRVRASVIVPTHDRDATLDLAIASIQAQTVKDIEIIIAGDGVTPAVRQVVERLAAQDPRIRFLDQPKAPGRGYDNRHRAVLASRGEHIFYSDDDDLWFPDHVETLGAALSRADVADSAVLSVARSSRLHRAFVNHAHPALRRLLAEGRLKVIFDTHLAHTRALYDRMGNMWTRGVADMLSAFAASDAVWATVNKPTALSLHGGARREATPRQRREEIATWQARITAGQPSAIAGEASGVRYLSRMMGGVPPKDGESLQDYLPRIGLSRDGVPEGGSTTGATAIDPVLSADAAAQMEAAFRLHRGSAPDGLPVEGILLPLLEPLLVRVPKARPVARLLRRAMPLKKALHLANRVRPERPHDDELLALLRAELLMMAGRPAEVRALVQQGVFDWYVPDAALMLARVAFREGHTDEGLGVLRDASERFTVRHDVRLALVEALWEHGSRDEAKAIAKPLLPRLPRNAVAKQLRAAIEADGGPATS